MIRALQLLVSHGLSGYLIIATAFAAIIVSLDRLFYLYIKVSYDASATLNQTKNLILSRNYGQAIQICNQEPGSPELQVVREGLMSIESGREAFQSAMTAAILSISRSCEQRLSYLSLVASSATLIGLFGTIMGLIKTFEAIAGADPAEKGRLLGLGISEAMYSTAAGVIVGVFAMVIHTICVAKADTIANQAQTTALNLIKWIEKSERQG